MLRHITFTFLLISILLTLTTSKSFCRTGSYFNAVAAIGAMQVSLSSTLITDTTYSWMGYSNILIDATSTIHLSNNLYSTVKESTL